MHLTTFFAAIAPLVLAAPRPEPLPMAKPAGSEGPLLTGVVNGVVKGIESIGSLESAIPAVLNDVEGITLAASTIVDAIANGTVLGTDVPALVTKLFQAVKPTATPASIPQALEWAAHAFDITNASTAPPSQGQNVLANALTLVLDGFTSSDITAVMNGSNPATNTDTNNNPAVPANKAFYNTVSGNAPFSLSEQSLRDALYFPPGFTWGKKQPVLMSPGTGTSGSKNFQSNIGKLLAAEDFADPVYLNVPDDLNNGIQGNAEYVAYGLQYLYAMTSKKPAIVTWSQGSLDAQWTFKYWRSVPGITTDHIAISPDYHGTLDSYPLCPGFALLNDIGCTPSIIQQSYNSNFINKLRSNDGDSGYVPTTTVYSLTDEIVQPQEGTAASGYLLDVRNVGVSNTFLQGACLGEPAGLVYTHEGVLYNPVAYALVVDALTHSGPGLFSRVENSCQDIVAPGLSLTDVVEAETLAVSLFLNAFAYNPKVTKEPAIESYATY